MEDNKGQQNPNEGKGRITPINIEEQMKASYIDYSMSVIVGRALPDVRDGLKPVHRRILHAMNEMGISHSKPYKKCARIVGEVLGKFHPHGDTAVYDALVRMAQDWNMRYDLIDNQGNFGSADGEGPAAMRYTEARLQKIAESMLDDIEKDTVDFQNNFDDSLTEPTVLPTRIPNLLVNGSSGIAVGMATNMMPHNLNEVVDGCFAFIDNKDITCEELMEYVKAPDFPTGGIIFGMEGIKQGMLTGRGRVVLRGKVNVETDAKGREKIVIYEVPYQVSRDALVEKVAYLVNNKIVEGISNVNNESNLKEGTRVVVELKRDAVAQVVINQLYKHTELQTSYGINNVAIVRGRPKTLNLRDLIKEFVNFRMEVVIRRTKFELRKAEEKAHILEGYLKALDNLDEVIKIIRESRTPDEAKTNLIAASVAGKWLVPKALEQYYIGDLSYSESFGLSEIQAKAILELRLQRLTGMEQQKIIEEYEEIMKTIAYLKSLLADEGIRFDVIKEELAEVKKQYGDARKTDIEYLADEMRIEDLIEEEDVVITISHLGYVKRTSSEQYRQQRRGGRGSMASKTREEDFIEQLFIASTHHTLMFFTEKGRCYWLKVYQIPEGDKTAKGRAMQNLIQIPPDDKVRAIIDVKNFEDKDYVGSHFITLATKRGIIKKTNLTDFSRPRQNGINAITIEEGDQLIEACLTNGENDVFLAVKSGKVIRFPESKVRSTGRGAIGVYGIEVDDAKDELIGMICVNKEQLASESILVVSEKGYGKRTSFEEYRITNRGGKGVKTINVTDKTGSLVGLLNVKEEEDLMITCKSGVTIRSAVTNISEQGRATQGVKLIKIDEGDEIAAITNIAKEEEIEEIDENVEVTEGSETAAEATNNETLNTNADATKNEENSQIEGEDETTPEVE
jgi:DNA gyrase subunit A